MNIYTIGTVNVPAQSITSNRVLRNTYGLLALTLLHLLGAVGGQE